MALEEEVATKKSKAKGKVYIVAEWCKGCNFCIEFCPTKVLAVSQEFNNKGYHPPFSKHPEKCSGCDLCGMVCPDLCIWGVKEEDDK